MVRRIGQGTPGAAERISPCLLDRLLASEPEIWRTLPRKTASISAEWVKQPFLYPHEYEATVVRDLNWLLVAKAPLMGAPLAEGPLAPAEFLRAFIPSVAGARSDEAATLADFPNVASSVLCYGFPDYTGVTAATDDELAAQLRRVLQAFEERLNPDTVRVERAHPGEETQGAEIGVNSTSDRASRKEAMHTRYFRIHADLWAQPWPSFLAEADLGEIGPNRAVRRKTPGGGVVGSDMPERIRVSTWDL